MKIITVAFRLNHLTASFFPLSLLLASYPSSASPMLAVGERVSLNKVILETNAPFLLFSQSLNQCRVIQRNQVPHLE